jgi:hypothetical protein
VNQNLRAVRFELTRVLHQPEFLVKGRLFPLNVRALFLHMEQVHPTENPATVGA